MPPLPPNITKAGILRSQRGWATSRQSLINNNIRGIGRARMPHGIGSVTGGMLNPPLPPSATRLAMPKGAMSGWAPVSLSSGSSGGGGATGLAVYAGRAISMLIATGPTTVTSGAVAITTTPTPTFPTTTDPLGATPTLNGGQYLNITFSDGRNYGLALTATPSVEYVMWDITDGAFGAGFATLTAVATNDVLQFRDFGSVAGGTEYTLTFT